MNEAICVKCGGPVVPGVNGFWRGLSTCPNGDPSGAIKDTMQAMHYAEHCGKPEVVVPFPSLKPMPYPVEPTAIEEEQQRRIADLEECLRACAFMLGSESQTCIACWKLIDAPHNAACPVRKAKELLRE